MATRHRLCVACLALYFGPTMSAVIELDPTNEADQVTIINKMTNCEWDKIVDVRSEFYYENWRITGGSHHPFTGTSLHNLDEATLIAENITSIAFYCWVSPFQSEPASVWFDATFGHLDIKVYDIKGLSYLDDIPGFCPFLTASDEAIDVLSPHCEGLTGTHECPAEEEMTEPDYTDTVDAATLDVLVTAVGLDVQQAGSLLQEDSTETESQTSVSLETTPVEEEADGATEAVEETPPAQEEPAAATFTSASTPSTKLEKNRSTATILTLVSVSALGVGWFLGVHKKLILQREAQAVNSRSIIAPNSSKAGKESEAEDVEEVENPLPPEVLRPAPAMFDLEQTELETVTEI